MSHAGPISQTLSALCGIVSPRIWAGNGVGVYAGETRTGTVSIGWFVLFALRRTGVQRLESLDTASK